MAIDIKAMKEIDKVSALTDRVAKRRKEYEEAPVWVSSQRARSYTEGWKEAEAEPFHLRRAKAFARILEDSQAIIRDGELIVGSETKYIRGAEVPVEFNPLTILNSMKTDHLAGLSEVVTANIEDKEKSALEEAARYWVGKSTRDIVHKAWERNFGDEYFNLLDDQSRVIEANIDGSPKASTSFNPRILKEGLNGIIARTGHTI